MRDGRGPRGGWALLIAALASLALCAPALAGGGEDQYGQPPGPSEGGEDPSSNGSDGGGGSGNGGCDLGEVRNAETGECERDRDCPEFSSQEDAQDFFISRGGPDEDPHRLNGDPEEDDDACEDTDFGGSDDGTTPSGGVDSGFGGTAQQPSDPAASPVLPVAVVLTLALGGLALRRRYS